MFIEFIKVTSSINDAISSDIDKLAPKLQDILTKNIYNKQIIEELMTLSFVVESHYEIIKKVLNCFEKFMVSKIEFMDEEVLNSITESRKIWNSLRNTDKKALNLYKELGDALMLASSKI